LDAGLAEYIKACSLSLPRQYRNDLNGRISFLSDSGRIHDAETLHAIRLRRNDLAHEGAQVGWDTFEADAAVIERALDHLARTDEVEVIREFVKMAKLLQTTAHGKYYLNARNFVPAVIAQLFVERLAIWMISIGLVAPIAIPKLVAALKDKEHMAG
jgi:hypothetical protein